LRTIKEGWEELELQEVLPGWGEQPQEGLPSLHPGLVSLASADLFAVLVVPLLRSCFLVVAPGL